MTPNISSAPTESTRYCKYCGVALKPGAGFCKSCGKAVTPTASTTPLFLPAHPTASFSEQFESLLEMLRNLRQHLGPIGQAMQTGVQSLIDQLTGRDVTVTFGGGFKAGKSSLLNALLDRNILPVNDLPETGVSCFIESGLQDRAYSINPTGRQPIKVDQRALTEMVSRTTLSGELNQAIENTERIEMTLYDAPIPPHVRWVDTPGINDNAVMTNRARQAARAADVLIWVFSSKQFLAETEQLYLAQFIAERGPAAVIFVLNVFLPADTAEAWDHFCNNKLPTHRNKLDDQAEDMGFTDHLKPIFVPISARAVSADLRGFGQKEVRSLIMHLSSEDHPLIRRARLFRIVPTLREIDSNLKSRLTEQEALLAQETARQQTEQRRQEFVSAVKKAFNIFEQDCRTYVNNRAEEIIAKIHTINKVEFNQALQQAGGLAIDRLISTLKTATHQFGQLEWTEERSVQLQKQFALPEMDSPVIWKTQTKLSSNGLGNKMSTGGRTGLLIGTALGGPMGALIGSVLGGALGAAAHALSDEGSSTEYVIDVEASQKKVRETAGQVIALLTATALAAGVALQSAMVIQPNVLPQDRKVLQGNIDALQLNLRAVIQCIQTIETLAQSEVQN